MDEEIRDDLTSILVDKKNGYGKEIEHNFKMPGEITVEITLSEYRDLVRCAENRDIKIKKAEDERFKMYWECDKLKKENEKLKEKLLKYVTEDDEEEKQEEGEA